MNFSSNSGDSNWIDNHLSKKGNNFLCRVDEAFIADHFNLYGLTSSSSGADFYRTLKRILNTDDETDASSSTLQFREEAEEREAERLYGLIHARYIMTRRGMDLMQEMLMHKVFSSCPRIACRTSLLPIGLSDDPDKEPVKLYCERCKDIFHPPSRKHNGLDGAFFGTGFPHMFFMMNPERSSSEKNKPFVGRLCGFRIHPSAIEIQLKIKEALNNTDKTEKITIKPPTKPEPSQDEPKAKIPATIVPAVDDVA